MLSKLRHPRRNRSISIGPQSEADAYEALAYRERRRREGRSEGTSTASTVHENGKESQDYFTLNTSRSTSRRPTAGLALTPGFSNDQLSQAVLDAETAVYTPLTPGIDEDRSSRASSQERRRIEREETEMFSKLTKPRVRYDVEVVTKLIVYSGECHDSGKEVVLTSPTGIGAIAVDWAPILFEVLGLGLDIAG